MKRFIEGESRTQTVLFPERLDDWIEESNPVRAIDAFVEELDFQNWVLKALSQPPQADPLTTPQRC